MLNGSPLTVNFEVLYETMFCFDLISLLNGISAFVIYLIKKDNTWTHCWGMREVHPEDISPKVNVIAKREFESAYKHVKFKHINRYGMSTLHDHEMIVPFTESECFSLMHENSRLIIKRNYFLIGNKEQSLPPKVYKRV